MMDGMMGFMHRRMLAPLLLIAILVGIVVSIARG